MKLIVDSGSTKSDWVLVRADNSRKGFSTMGFNPYFHNETTIANAILQHEELKNVRTDIDAVHYYGAGCSSKSLRSVVENALQSAFVNATISVDHDLTACAYSTYDGAPGISCILGTGSNSCHFDGEKVVEEVPALAYILGDEGSGSYYGKQLLSAYLYKTLPDHIHQSFFEEYGLSKDDILENVYMKPNANVYIASFMKFASKHRDDPYFENMVYEGMKKFMQTHVCCYKDHKTVNVHFIGSIGYYFERELRKAAEELRISVGTIIKKPIDGLVQYHMNYAKQQTA
ncbi:MAG: ATPase [Flavobacteriales bacterium]|nr:ATPase [Flavobacteriales bacterium]